tara:strand:- start:70424 stop:71011 length:588 start_codon:yes stop_codon:yes gene_type:complete
VSFWAKFFGKKKKKEKSKYLPENEIPNDLSFVKKFTIKGGRFLFCENNNETSFNFNEILIENNWNLNEVFCFDNDIKKKLNVDILKDEFSPKNFKTCIIKCEFLISNTGLILVCDKQIKHFKLKELPNTLIILSETNQFSKDVSEAMSLLKNKYENTIPTNITTINIYNYLEKENNMSLDKNNSKNIYLLHQDYN